jgi:septum formation inhibitor MinC
MSSGTAAATEIGAGDRWGETPPPQVEARPAAILKGGPRGLEILVDGGATVDMIEAALTRRLEEAPGFFRGSDVRVRIDGAMPAGCLARLEAIAATFELAIVEVGPRKPRPVEASAPVPQPALAAGTAPAGAERAESLESPVSPELPSAPVSEALAPTLMFAAAPAPAPAPAPALPDPPEPPEISIVEASDPRIDVSIAAPAPERTRMVVGPVRSGVILDHPGNLIVVGDVNPGAEVRAQGNIVILGRLRGIAHAGIGREHGFILALRLEPQQLRIGRVVARASDAEPAASASSGTEIAYIDTTDRNIVVERYAGKLPSGLAAGI